MAPGDYGSGGFLARPRITLLVLVLASLTLVTISYKSHGSGLGSIFQNSLRSITDPIRSTANSVIRPVGDVFSGAFDYSNLKSENAKLKSEVQTLKNQDILANKYQNEVKQLTRLDNIPFSQGLKSVTAIVDNYSPTNTQLTVDLDKGSAQGIRVGEPVVSSLGLVGRVKTVTKGSSTVLLIADPTSAVGVEFGKSRTVALAVGNGSFKTLNVELVNPGTSLRNGETMYTSGLQGGIFPPNIPVGVVASHSYLPGALQEHVTLSPLADLAHLQYVKVLDWLPGGGK